MPIAVRRITGLRASMWTMCICMTCVGHQDNKFLCLVRLTAKRHGAEVYGRAQSRSIRCILLMVLLAATREMDGL
jgi:hypothetical protein